MVDSFFFFNLLEIKDFRARRNLRELNSCYRGENCEHELVSDFSKGAWLISDPGVEIRLVTSLHGPASPAVALGWTEDQTSQFPFCPELGLAGLRAASTVIRQ